MYNWEERIEPVAVAEVLFSPVGAVIARRLVGGQSADEKTEAATVRFRRFPFGLVLGPDALRVACSPLRAFSLLSGVNIRTSSEWDRVYRSIRF